MDSILIVDDKQSLRFMLRKALERTQYSVDEAADGSSALEKVQQTTYDLILTDLKLPDMLGLEVLKLMKRVDSATPVIFMTAYGSVETAVEAMRNGAYDFIEKPVDLDHLLLLIERALERKHLVTENFLLKEELASRIGVPKIVGEHPSIVAVGQQVQQVAITNTTVLLLGESGTGKELFAKAIHNLSPRKNHPFVTVNCAAIPESLIENELFGHEKGAYTGASERAIGKFELAHRGTIFLDEIGELPLAVQGKILRVLEERKLDRVGGTVPVHVDVRIIAATNKDLKASVDNKEFRGDLFYRLSVFPIVLPPIRHRKSDLPLLVNYFLSLFAVELKKKNLRISPEAMQQIMEYEWPGNVRELKNCIERATIIANDDFIRPEDLNISSAASKGAPVSVDHYNNIVVNVNLDGTLNEITAKLISEVEKIKIESVMKETGGNKMRAAEALSISYKTLLNKIKEFGM